MLEALAIAIHPQTKVGGILADKFRDEDHPDREEVLGWARNHQGQHRKAKGLDIKTRPPALCRAL